jgi:glycosyltransferase involved in cell wall biosynthesis
MRVLSISTDRKIFDDVSSVLSRSLQYASKMQELHVVVFSLKSQNLERKNIGNLFIYPTNSTSKLFYIFDAIKIGAEIIKKNEFDINSSLITCQDPFETGLVGVRLKKYFHFPLQIQVHTDFLSPYFKNNLLNIIRVFISKKTIPKADGIRVVSSVIKDSLNDNFISLKARLDVLPIYVDIENIIERSEKFYNSERIKHSVLMVSRFAKEKRIDTALSVLENVVNKGYKDISLSIVGSGPEKSNILKRIDKLGLLNNVKVLEWEKDVLSSYRKAEIFLVTSEYEGYGMTLIEAGASGVPIVTTEVGIAKTDLFKDGVNAYVCPVGDVECLSRGIMDLITNEERRKSFTNNMRDSIKSISLTNEEYVKKYVSLLETIITK